MKIKYFVLPTIVTCLAFASTACNERNNPRNNHRGSAGNDSSVRPNHNRNMNPQSSEVAYINNGTSYSNGANGSLDGTNGTQNGTNNGYSTNYINKYTNGSSYSTNAPSSNQNGSSYGSNNSNGFGYGSSSSNLNSRGSLVTPFNSNTNANSGACSTMDFSVFEESDEENTYNTYGFTRGDIKNLHIYKYDPKSEQTINGTVTKILRVQFPDKNCYLIAVVNTTQGNVLANLGPVWFIDENNMSVNEGDQLDLTGSVVRTNGRYIVFVSQFKKNGQTLMLRSQNGSPQWGSPKSQKGAKVAN